MNTTNAVTSVSIKLAPLDRRCKYWVKIIRAGQGMPTPDRITGAADHPGGPRVARWSARRRSRHGWLRERAGTRRGLITTRAASAAHFHRGGAPC